MLQEAEIQILLTSGENYRKISLLINNGKTVELNIFVKSIIVPYLNNELVNGKIIDYMIDFVPYPNKVYTFRIMYKIDNSPNHYTQTISINPMSNVLLRKEKLKTILND